MGIVELSTKNFAETVEQDGIVLIDWWAPWCGPCRAFAPIYEKVAKGHEDITFAKVNTQDQPKLASEFDIQAIPTLMAFRDGVLVFAQPGMMPAKALEGLIAQVKGLDMQDVRKKIAEHEGASAHA